MIFAREQRLSIEHFGENTAGTPDINLNIILLPGEHDLGGAVVSRRHVSSHLRILNSGQAEIAYLQVTILVDENVTGLQVAVDDTGGVDVFQTTLHCC